MMLTRVPDFDDAKANFMAAARYGLHARLHWFGGKTYGAEDLILNQLLPIAREGLLSHEIAPADVERYVTVLEQRVRSGRTGAQWVLDSLESMDGQGRPDERYRSLTATMLSRSTSTTWLQYPVLPYSSAKR